jgi:hypothetical protein
MVEPTTFGFDEHTAKTNAFQTSLQLDPAELARRVRSEFEACVAALRANGVDVVVFASADLAPKPSAVFPNNWLSMWPDGRVYLYPMATASRRLEREGAVIDRLRESFRVDRVVDISRHEEKGKHLESTGVMVFDHTHKVAYGCISGRCDEGLFRRHARQLGYEAQVFRAHDANGVPIYHTNVMMAVQESTAVVCSEAITDLDERERITQRLQDSGREVVDISYDQMGRFCGNVMQLAGTDGKRMLLLSQTAHNAFTPEQRAVLARDSVLVPVAVPTLEALGGGSVRCMVAEIFLPALIMV